MTEVTRPAMTDDDGTFTTGTVVNEALVDDVLDQIDDQCHSATNPTVKPKATTDEVVAARGSKASLDARLDVALEEDGTLKSQASLVSASQVQSALGGRNVAVNGDLDDWSNGGALAPDNFTLAGAAATIARTGVAMADTFHFGTGSGFAAKVTRAGTNWTLTQDVIAAADFAKYVNVKGQKFSVSVKAKTAIGSYLRIVVDDGVTTTASGYHTGGGTEEHLSATHTISASATKLSVYVSGEGSNGDGYVGGFNFVFSDLAPSDWQPLSLTPDAGATRRGLVGLLAQTMGAGLKTFPGGVAFSGGVSLLDTIFARSSADFTKNGNTTLGDVTGLAFAVGASQTWLFLFILHGKSSDAADWKFTLTGPAAPTAIRFGVVSSNTNPGTGDASSFASAIAASGTGGSDQALIIGGLLRNGANAGTVQLQAAQLASDATDTKVYAESCVLAVRLV